MRDMYGVACFLSKMCLQEVNMTVLLRIWVKNTVHDVKTQQLSSKEVLGAAVSKEGPAGRLQRLEKTHHYWFHEKDSMVKWASSCQKFRQKYLLNDPFL